jgi:hypothetical protein
LREHRRFPAEEPEAIFPMLLWYRGYFVYFVSIPIVSSCATTDAFVMQWRLLAWQ